MPAAVNNHRFSATNVHKPILMHTFVHVVRSVNDLLFVSGLVKTDDSHDTILYDLRALCFLLIRGMSSQAKTDQNCFPARRASGAARQRTGFGRFSIGVPTRRSETETKKKK